MTELMRRRRALMGVGGGSPYEHGTWDDLFFCIDNGTYATDYALGEILPLDLGTEGVVNAQIVAFDTDTKTGGGLAPVTFISQYLLETTKRFNPQLAGASGNRTVGTGTIGGWANCELRSYIQNTIAPLVPSVVSRRIVSVEKATRIYDSTETVQTNDMTSDMLWIPSRDEYFQTTFEGTNAVRYTYLSTRDSRKKSKPGSTFGYHRLRTANSTTNTQMCSGGGDGDSLTVITAYAFCIGFCVG